MTKSFWIPLVLGLSVLALGWGYPSAESLGLSKTSATVFGALLLALAGGLAWVFREDDKTRSGGRGGDARASNGATAIGGDGGRSGVASGGDGGSARASGTGSRAKGGRGGDG